MNYYTSFKQCVAVRSLLCKVCPGVSSRDEEWLRPMCEGRSRGHTISSFSALTNPRFFSDYAFKANIDCDSKYIRYRPVYIGRQQDVKIDG